MRSDFLCRGLLICAVLPAVVFAKQPVDDIEKITVTSQRIERSIYQLASNVTLIDESTIESLKLTDLELLVALAPNVAIQALQGDYEYIQMRGLPRNPEQPTVSVYIDDVPYSNLYGLNLSMLNIEKVEILRGPQANLFGRNTRDGVIAITTKKSADETELNLAIGMAQYDQQELEATLLTPLIKDKLTMSAALKSINREGVVNNSMLTGELDEVDQKLLRLAFNWTPTQQLDIQLSAEKVKKRNGAYPYVSGAEKLNRGDDLSIAMDIDNQFDMDSGSLALQVNWQLSPDWRLSSISSWSKTDVFGRFDADFSSLDYGFQDSKLEDTDVYQEVRLASTSNHSRYDWLFGLSYSQNKDRNSNEWLVGMSSINGQIEKTGYVAYGDVNWRLADTWTLQTGLRWVNEHISSDTTFYNGYYPVPAAQTEGTTKLSDTRWLGKIAINKSLSEYQTLYANYGQGYLSAGTTWISEQYDATASRLGHGVSYAPELSRTFELGYKSLLPAWHASVDFTVYHSVIDDFQYSYVDALGLSRIASMEQVVSKGFEFAFNLDITDSLKWTLSTGYNDAHISRLGTQLKDLGEIGANEADRIPSVPKSNIHNHLNYSFELTDQLVIASSISWDHYGETSFDFPGKLRQGNYNLLAANIAVEFADNWQVSIWGKNLTDERYQQYRVQYVNFDIANYGMPRQVGISLNKQF